jgi:MoxR-like ATPase
MLSLSGDVKFSDIFGFQPKGIPDFAVDIKRDWSEWAEQFIPSKDRFANWVFSDDVPELVFTMLYGGKCRNVGPPGCGKTDVGEVICAYLGVPYLSLSMNSAVEITDLAGKTNVRGGETLFIESTLVKFYRESGTRMIQVNELTKTRADVCMFFQPAWDSQNYLLLQEKEEDNIIRPGGGLMWYATDNTLGLGDDIDKYSAANVLDGSTLDRWTANFRATYLPADKEQGLVRAWQPGIKDPLAKKLVQFAGLCRTAFAEGSLSLPVSPRHLKSIADLTAAWGNPVRAIGVVVWNAVPKEEQPAIQSFMDTVGFDATYGKLSV